MLDACKRVLVGDGAMHPVLLLAPLAIRALLLLFDGHPYWFFGDSIAYLGAKAPLVERPFAYSAFVHSILALGPAPLVPVAQALMGALTALSYYVIARRYFGMAKPLAVGLYITVSLWPVNLLYEQTLLAEALYSFFLALALMSLFETLRTGRGAGFHGLWLAALCLTRTIGIVMIPISIIGIFMMPRQADNEVRSRQVGGLLVVFALLVVPYASLQHHNHGFFGLVAFRGRTMLPYVRELVRPEAIEDLEIRAVWKRHVFEDRSKANDVVRWGDGLVSHLRKLFVERYPGADADEIEVRLDAELERMASGALVAEPLGYAAIVARQVAVVLFDTVATSSTRALVQSHGHAQAGRSEWIADASRPQSKNAQHICDCEIPETGRAFLFHLVRRGFDSRAPLLLIAYGLFGVAWRRRRLTAAHVLVAGWCITITFSPVLAQEYFGRYFVPAINPTLLLVGLGLGSLPGRVTPWLVTLGIVAEILSSALGLPRVNARTLDFSKTGVWEGAVTAATYEEEISLSPLRRVGRCVLRLSGEIESPPAAIWMALPSDPDNDGTPPDNFAERDRGRDLSAARSVHFEVAGTPPPESVVFWLEDTTGAKTSGAPGSPKLSDYVDDLERDKLQRVEIPMQAFPLHFTSQQHGTRKVDLTHIKYFGADIIATGDNGGQHDLHIGDIRWDAEDPVYWCTQVPLLP